MRWWSCLGAESAEVLRAVYDGQSTPNLLHSFYVYTVK